MYPILDDFSSWGRDDDIQGVLSIGYTHPKGKQKPPVYDLST